MSELSPAAKTVLDAFLGDAENTGLQMDDLRENVAAALRAAADQVLPEEPLHGGDQRWMFERDARQACRKKLLAIAAELNGDSNV